MKPIALLCGIALLMMPVAAAGQVPEVHSVYLLPMRGGFDQYLANRLTVGGVMQVVTDPAKADAIFTDQIGKPFEKSLEELYPKKEEAEPEPSAPPEDKAAPPAGKPAAKEERESEEARKSQEPPVVVFTSGRARGTVFLVDAKTRHVIWSTYEPPKNLRSDQLDKTAERIAQALKKHLGHTK